RNASATDNSPESSCRSRNPDRARYDPASLPRGGQSRTSLSVPASPEPQCQTPVASSSTPPDVPARASTQRHISIPPASSPFVDPSEIRLRHSQSRRLLAPPHAQLWLCKCLPKPQHPAVSF